MDPTYKRTLKARARVTLAPIGGSCSFLEKLAPPVAGFRLPKKETYLALILDQVEKDFEDVELQKSSC